MDGTYKQDVRASCIDLDGVILAQPPTLPPVPARSAADMLFAASLPHFEFTPDKSLDETSKRQSLLQTLEPVLGSLQSTWSDPAWTDLSIVELAVKGRTFPSSLKEEQLVSRLSDCYSIFSLCAALDRDGKSYDPQIRTHQFLTLHSISI